MCLAQALTLADHNRACDVLCAENEILDTNDKRHMGTREPRFNKSDAAQGYRMTVSDRRFTSILAARTPQMRIISNRHHISPRFVGVRTAEGTTFATNMSGVRFPTSLTFSWIRYSDSRPDHLGAMQLGIVSPPDFLQCHFDCVGTLQTILQSN
jgi:hypothetical protein